MRQALKDVDLLHQVGYFIFRESLEADPLDSYHLAGVEIEGPIHRSKLSAADAITNLLEGSHQILKSALNEYVVESLT
jgi:hypothetical protein